MASRPQPLLRSIRRVRRQDDVGDEVDDKVASADAGEDGTGDDGASEPHRARACRLASDSGASDDEDEDEQASGLTRSTTTALPSAVDS